MHLTYYKVYNQGELKKVGIGWRYVFAKEGRKWATILAPFSGLVEKVRLRKWRDMTPVKMGESDADFCGAIERLSRSKIIPVPLRELASELGCSLKATQ